MTDSTPHEPLDDVSEARETAEKNVTMAGNVLNVMSMSWPGQAINASMAAAQSVQNTAQWAANGFTTVTPGILETGVSTIGGWTPLLVGAGPAIHAVSEGFQGHFKNAVTSVAKGASMIGTVAVEASMMSLAFPAEIASLIFTGKFLTTHVGNLADQVMTDAIGKSEDTTPKPAVNTPMFGVPMQQQVIPPTLRYAVVPGQSMTPMMQTIPQTGKGMQLIAPRAASSPWTTRMAEQGVAPRPSQGFAQAELARQQAASLLPPGAGLPLA